MESKKYKRVTNCYRTCFNQIYTTNRNQLWKKNARKEKCVRIISYTIHAPVKKQTKNKQIKYVAFKQGTRNIISTMNTTYYKP